MNRETTLLIKARRRVNIFQEVLFWLRMRVEFTFRLGCCAGIGESWKKMTRNSKNGGGALRRLLRS
jgi:hypothetical protein